MGYRFRAPADGARRGAQFGYPRAMAKTKTVFTCDSCGAQQPKWQGQCPDCGAWNSLAESAPMTRRTERAQPAGQVALTRLGSVDVARVDRLSTGLSEFDRVL